MNDQRVLSSDGGRSDQIADKIGHIVALHDDALHHIKDKTGQQGWDQSLHNERKEVFKFATWNLVNELDIPD